MVRKRGLEPPHLAAPDPKSGASANSATSAFKIIKWQLYNDFFRFLQDSLNFYGVFGLQSHKHLNKIADL